MYTRSSISEGDSALFFKTFGRIDQRPPNHFASLLRGFGPAQIDGRDSSKFRRRWRHVNDVEVARIRNLEIDEMLTGREIDVVCRRHEVVLRAKKLDGHRRRSIPDERQPLQPHDREKWRAPADREQRRFAQEERGQMTEPRTDPEPGSLETA